MSPAVVEHWIVRLRQRLDAAEARSTSLTTRVETLEALLLNVPAERLLGRHDGTPGVAQFVRIGTGLDLVGDTLVNTGGGSPGVASFTLICVDDASEHEVECILQNGRYLIRPNQAPGGASAVSGKTLSCTTGSDTSAHVLRLRLVQGYYAIEMVQSPGGSDPLSSISMTCVTDGSSRSVVCVLEQGFYTWNVV